MTISCDYIMSPHSNVKFIPELLHLNRERLLMFRAIHLDHASDAPGVGRDDVEQQSTAVLDRSLHGDVVGVPLPQLRIEE